MRNAIVYEQFGLSFVAGYVDTVSFIAMSGLFTAHVTGNLVLAAAHLSGHGGTQAAANLVMIPVFMLAVAIATLLARTRLCSTLTPRQRVMLFLGAELAFLVAFWWAGVTMSALKGFPLVAPADVVPAATVGVAALAIQNALPRLTGLARLPTTVMTGNLTQSTIDMTTLAVPWIGRTDPQNAEARNRLTKLAPGVLGFIVGAATAAPLSAWVQFQAVGVACLALLVTMPAAIAAAQERP